MNLGFDKMIGGTIRRVSTVYRISSNPIRSYTLYYTRGRKWCLSVPIPADAEVPDGVRFTYECTHLRKDAQALKTILEALAEMRAGSIPVPSTSLRRGFGWQAKWSNARLGAWERTKNLRRFDGAQIRNAKRSGEGATARSILRRQDSDLSEPTLSRAPVVYGRKASCTDSYSRRSNGV